MSGNSRRLRHGKVELALHELRAGTGRPLLLLHGLGERSPRAVPSWAAGWPGAVVALDFSGHGASTVPSGGGYTAEVLMADADVALAEIGQATVVGRGVGAYVALMVAGARPGLVRGAVLADGPGIAGGGPAPGTTVVAAVAPDALAAAPPDPWALVELARDVRPPDYALGYARLALQRSEAATPLVVSASWRAPWLSAVCEEYGVRELPLSAAVALYAEER